MSDKNFDSLNNQFEAAKQKSEKLSKDEEKQKQIDEEEQKRRAEIFKDIDLDKAYAGADYELNKKIKIHLPSVQEIIDYGPDKFWSFLTTFCANPTALKLLLNDVFQKKWYYMSDWDLFVLLHQSYPLESTKLFFGDELDFTKFVKLEITHEDQIDKRTKKPVVETILIDPDSIESGDLFVIDEAIHTKMVNYLRAIFDYHPSTDKPATKLGAQWLLERDRDNIAFAKRKAKENPSSSSFLLPLLSLFFKTYPGYTTKDLDKVNYFFFMDAIRRTQEYENTQALLHGVYGGMLDLNHKKNKKLKKDLNFLKQLY